MQSSILKFWPIWNDSDPEYLAQEFSYLWYQVSRAVVFDDI